MKKRFLLKVRGVTIMELLVALLITSLVATASFWGYQFLMQYYGGNVKYKQGRLQEMQLASQVSRMTHECISVTYSEASNSIVFHEPDSRLTFGDGYVLLGHERLDTLDVDCKSLEIKKVEDDKGELVKSYSFVIKSPVDSTRFHFSKDYSSEYLMSNGY